MGIEPERDYFVMFGPLSEIRTQTCRDFKSLASTSWANRGYLAADIGFEPMDPCESAV